MNWKKLNLRPADRIVVPKSRFRLVQHHAIYLGQNNLGQYVIAENKIGIGVRLITADDFFSDVIEVTRIDRFTGSNYERDNVVWNAQSKVGLAYDLFTYNCEHYVTESITGKAVSSQIKNILGIGVSVLFLALLIKE